MTSNRSLMWIATGAAAAMGGVAILWQDARYRRGLPRGDTALVDAARKLNRSAGVLATAVLADSGMEHLRGDFERPAMYAPLVAAALSLLASGHGVADRRREAHWLRDPAYLLAAVTGLAGTGFHLYNVGKRPGGYSWENLFYAAPIGAPSALVLSGMLGVLAERVRDAAPQPAPHVLGVSAADAVAALAAGGLLGTAAEAALLHFRGAFQHPAMYLPVAAPPLAALMLAAAAVLDDRTPRLRWWSRVTLRFTALLGFAGSAFHANGIARSMGGWSNWRQNLLAGPPLPAPPSFTGLAMAGLAAHELLRERSTRGDAHGRQALTDRAAARAFAPFSRWRGARRDGAAT
ncbi:hypothetical protein [Chitinasiproducens palmae]|uniref:Uncharacterized protein n=1 Tax=Chitinasiproducens palmae TaxID=1770053 RepID=A0A1H2PKR0_9BURK|nr:hypothetical protein [Chitinasiproducens palmae]SDV46160.1 hypothetical protein SAMN05216551_101131 [Chitinasiproducens palmae]